MSRHPTGPELAAKTLQKAARDYARAKAKAAEIMLAARLNLAGAVVDGHNEGVRKVDIGRHLIVDGRQVWSRAWIEKTINAAGKDEPS